MTPEEFESLEEEARASWIKLLPVPRGEVRGSYRLIPECPMDRPILQSILGSSISVEGPGLIEDLRKRNRGIPERIFSKSD
jgi:hypothetical protein